MTDQEIESLRTVVQYLWRTEQRNFEEHERKKGTPPDNLIFSLLETLRRYVTDEQVDDSALRQSGTHTQ